MAEDQDKSVAKLQAMGPRSLSLFLLCSISALWCSGAQAQLPPGVRQALRQAQVPPQAISVLVQPLDADTSPARLLHRENEPMNPASVMKLFTTYAGLQLLGPDHVWRTRVYATGPVHEGVLQGSLVVQGSGDPKLVIERAQAMVCLLYTSPSPRDTERSRMPSSA